MRLTAVLVTKGDRDISEVLASLSGFDELIVWDNSKAPKDVKVFGRFAGAMLAQNNDIYIQDDDSIVQWPVLKYLYESYTHIPDLCVCNFPIHRRSEYAGSNIALLGWGTIFRKQLLRVFNPYLLRYGVDELFYRECDRIFSFMCHDFTRFVDVGVNQLDYAFGKDRMGTEERHGADLKEIKHRLSALKQ